MEPAFIRAYVVLISKPSKIVWMHPWQRRQRSRCWFLSGRATQILFCTIVDIMALVFSGKLTSLRRLSHDGTISGLGLDLAELQPLVEKRQKSKVVSTLPIFDPADPACGLMNTRQAREKLATAPNTVTELLNLGFLKQVKGFNPKTQRVRDYICSKSVESFMENYISLAHLAERRGMFGVHVRDKVAEKVSNPCSNLPVGIPAIT